MLHAIYIFLTYIYSSPVIYIYIYKCNEYIWRCMILYIQCSVFFYMHHRSLYIRTYIYIYIHIYICIHVYICVYIRIQMYMHMYIDHIKLYGKYVMRIYIHIYQHIYTNMHIYMYKYIYLNIHIYIRRNVHICECFRSSAALMLQQMKYDTKHILHIQYTSI